MPIINEVAYPKYKVYLSAIQTTMALDYGTDVFTLPAGESINLTTVFNSNDFKKGGDYLGPMVVAGVTRPQSSHRVLTPSTVGLEFTETQSELTSFCIYHYSIKNNSAHSVSFTIHFFHD
jgi:hypothetical protein